MGLYCLALVPANTLPKTPLGGIHISDTKQYFLDGNLHPCNILMCPHTCVTNLPKPRQKQPGMCNIWSSSLKCSCLCIFYETTQAYETFLPPLPTYAVGVGPASVVLGNLVAGKRIAQAAGRDLGMIEDQDLVRKVKHHVQLFIPDFHKSSTSAPHAARDLQITDIENVAVSKI